MNVICIVDQDHQRSVVAEDLGILKAFSRWWLQHWKWRNTYPGGRKRKTKKLPKITILEDQEPSVQSADRIKVVEVWSWRNMFHQNLETGHHRIYIWKQIVSPILERIPLKKLYLKVVKLGSYMKQQTSKWRSHVQQCFSKSIYIYDLIFRVTHISNLPTTVCVKFTCALVGEWVWLSGVNI